MNRNCLDPCLIRQLSEDFRPIAERLRSIEEAAALSPNKRVRSWTMGIHREAREISDHLERIETAISAYEHEDP